MRIGRPSARNRSTFCGNRQIMGSRFAEPDPGIDHDPLAGNAGLLQGVEAFRQVGGNFSQHVVIVGILLHRGGRPFHVHANDAGLGSGQTEAIAGSKVRPDTSLTMTTPESASLAGPPRRFWYRWTTGPSSR